MGPGPKWPHGLKVSPWAQSWPIGPKWAQGPKWAWAQSGPMGPKWAQGPKVGPGPKVNPWGTRSRGARAEGDAGRGSQGKVGRRRCRSQGPARTTSTTKTRITTKTTTRTRILCPGPPPYRYALRENIPFGHPHSDFPTSKSGVQPNALSSRKRHPARD